VSPKVLLSLLIHSIRPDYHYYLRAHAEICWNVSCYAVPPSRTIGS
jgi:hypothetical protein